MEGIRPDWLEKRKKRQIDWRRGWSHGIGEQARWIGAAATRRRLRIRGAAGHPPSPFPSISKSATSPDTSRREVYARPRRCCRFPRAKPSRAAPRPLFPNARRCCRFPRAQPFPRSRAAPQPHFSPVRARNIVRAALALRKNRRHSRLGDDSGRHTHEVRQESISAWTPRRQLKNHDWMHRCNYESHNDRV